MLHYGHLLTALGAACAPHSRGNGTACPCGRHAALKVLEALGGELSAIEAVVRLSEKVWP